MIENSELPDSIKKVGFDFRWDSSKIWKLDVPITEMDINELIWHFEIPFWEKDGTDDYNLIPREVINHKEGTKIHREKIPEILKNNGV